MKRKGNCELRATAYHEAGHAVAAFRNRVALNSVRIQVDDDSLGHTRHDNLFKNRDIEWGASTANEKRMRRLVLVALAGPTAERRYRSRNGLPKWRAEQSQSDFHSAHDLVSYFTGSNDQTQMALDELQAEAEAFVQDHWKEIRSVAEALLRHNRLSAREIGQAIVSASR